MKTRRCILAALCAAYLPLILGAVPAQAADDRATALRVEVSSPRNAIGTLNCRLFSDAGAFPDGDGVRTVRVAIGSAQAACVFEDLPAGIYAVAVVHDENGNGKLDRNFLGIPIEGYGVSNNRTYAASSPKWDESRFAVTPREPRVLRITLRY